MYKVTKQYGRGSEINVASFLRTLAEAKTVVDEKIKAESLGSNVLYRIYEDDEVRSEFDAEKINAAASANQEDASGQGKGQQASFRPTPLNTSPRPPGTPPKWIHEADDDKDKK